MKIFSNKGIVPLIICGMSTAINAQAQVLIDSVIVKLNPGALMTVKDFDLSSTWDITGAGTVYMTSNEVRNINFNYDNITIPHSDAKSLRNLKVNVPKGLFLTGSVIVQDSLKFIAGKIYTGNNIFNANFNTYYSGIGDSSYVCTNDTNGYFRLWFGESAGSGFFNAPLGSLYHYLPAQVSRTYPTADIPYEYISIRAAQEALPEKPEFVHNFLNAYWKLIPSGFEYDYTVRGTYKDILVGGTESLMTSYALENDTLKNGTAVNTTLNTTEFNFASYDDTAYLTAFNPFLYVNAKVFLQGSMQGLTMKKSLNTLQLIPIEQPYNTAPWNYSGLEYAIATASYEVDYPVHPDATDWVLVELRDPLDATNVISRRAGLLLSNGSIKDTDGNSLLGFNATPGMYYIAIHHRNHLPIRSSAMHVLSSNSSLYDFTDNQSKAFQNETVSTNTAMRNNGNGTFSMWGGNGANTTITSYNTLRNGGSLALNDYLYINSLVSSSPTGIIPNVYHKGDYNMDGSVRNSGSSFLNDLMFIQNTLLTNPIFNAHK